ncbi:MAG: hypothetical protein K5683_12645 [Prevotella sp.]|nr:hypothetical protein [Prevotella sp.]
MRTILLTLLLLCCLNSQAQNISYVEAKNSWYHIYDEDGKKTGALSSNLGELAGYGTEFIILKTKNWYYLYDGKGKKLKGLSRSTIGEVIAVTGKTFTSRHGNWIFTWDKDGKKISSHSAR